MSDFLDRLITQLSGEDFEEVPVGIYEFVTSPDYCGLDKLSDHQYTLIKAMTQIYKKETLISWLGDEEGNKRWKETFREIIAALGKGCLTIDSEIYDANDGQWRTMGSILESYGGYSAGTDGNSINPEFRTEAFSEGNADVYEVVTSVGHKIKVSDGHRFLTKSGLKKLEDIAPNEKIAVASKLPIMNPIDIDVREVKLLGYWLGDGMMPTDENPTLNVDFSGYETQALEEYVSICKSYGDIPNVTKHHTKDMYFVRHSRNTPLYDIVRRHGLWGKRAYNKEIPRAVYGLSDEQLAVFISRLHGTDGCVYMKKSRGGYQPTIEYCSISENLAVGYQRLLARLGIVARLRSRIPKYTYKGEKLDGQRAYYLTVSDAEGFTRFGKQITLLDKQHLLDEGLSVYAGKKIRVSARYDGDIYWDTIKLIKEVGTEEVFTITASETGTYVANLILNGNSGK